MSPVKYFLLLLALHFSVSDLHFRASGDSLPPPTVCDSSCQQHLPPPGPPLSGYPSYGYPPPPPPSGDPIYGALAPPPPHELRQSKCPPAAGVQCCTPPYPYTYVPYGEGEGSASTLILPILATLMMLFSSFIFLF